MKRRRGNLQDEPESTLGHRPQELEHKEEERPARRDATEAPQEQPPPASLDDTEPPLW